MRDFCYWNQSRIPPIIAPIKSGPTFDITRIKLPAPATNPIIGAPVRADVKNNSNTPSTIAGKKTAIIAFEIPPAFLPPTIPAINGPNPGSQNSKIDIKNIQKMPDIMLPFFCFAIIFSF